MPCLPLTASFSRLSCSSPAWGRSKLADGCGLVHESYHDHVMLASLLAARDSEVVGLRVGDVDWTTKIVTIAQQTYPRRGGLVTKATKGRRARPAPILEALEPVFKRLTDGRAPE